MDEIWGAAEAGVAESIATLRTITTAITAVIFFIVSSRGDSDIVLICHP
jgi:hypothetical protein